MKPSHSDSLGDQDEATLENSPFDQPNFHPYSWIFILWFRLKLSLLLQRLPNQHQNCPSHQLSPSRKSHHVPSCQACREGCLQTLEPKSACWATSPMTWCFASRGCQSSYWPSAEIPRRFCMEVREEETWQQVPECGWDRVTGKNQPNKRKRHHDSW
ncbi:hypothetical protein AV530_009765 [Patagioenas fasciata monilis]|uniref:Uncharacterized protein n=1 Tax=Patagioenas fasciata monilis TaxID=372326 RepID=A0A1V4K9Z7_PATFA|nr:hypothetical protein AV530_009765 [Patagioenas fasciata monilis]